MNKIEFRGKKTDGTWVYGDLYQGEMDGKSFTAIITRNETKLWPKESMPENSAIVFFTDEFHIVYPETVGQLHYESEHGRYFDGDVYFHAGYGYEVVSSLCQIQLALMSGHDDDIGKIIGNVFENENLITKP